ncbi:hypothetical protein KFE25_010763 [Diacronema lutheri]|uniref:Clusterin-associated protein 1 n=2 Tax=Diacronema lutheri TaxID=2081491 RepID=A0A8J5XHB8_DIALT|nr:hypothetical protein KFE25_010763 [Diacronema lutheri]
MSHRELRNLTEMLRALGYPHLVSMQSFRTPNFELVADILHWLVERYDSSISIDDSIETEADRVHFLKETAQAMMLKGRIKLNLKNLYSANGFAVKELLKVAAVLHDAHRGAADADAAGGGGGGDDELAVPDAVGTAKFADLKTTRALAADIVRHGAKLHELLALHPENRELHAKALSRSFELPDVQRRLAAQAETMASQVEEMDRMLANVSKDEAALRAKIDKRKAELERHEKRLSSLATVRPAFLDEYEKLEGALVVQYDAYLSNWRNMQFLEAELDAVHAAELEGLEAHERQMRAMQRVLREEELRLMRGQAQIDEQAIDEALMMEARGNGPSAGNSRSSSRGGGGAPQRPTKRPGGAGMRRGSADGAGMRRGSADAGGRGGNVGQAGGAGAVVGSMNPAEDDDDDDDDDGEDDEDEDDDTADGRRGAHGMGDDDEDGLIDDDDEDDEDEDEDEDGDEDGEGDDAGSDDQF